jgi:hypothetical protein
VPGAFCVCATSDADRAINRYVLMGGYYFNFRALFSRLRTIDPLIALR